METRIAYDPVARRNMRMYVAFVHTEEFAGTVAEIAEDERERRNGKRSVYILGGDYADGYMMLCAYKRDAERVGKEWARPRSVHLNESQRTYVNDIRLYGDPRVLRVEQCERWKFPPV